jgi:DNA-binding LacI/PurR family transcriptional regulator
MAVRLKDIAQDLNISIVTVSKVLRKHPDIGVETRQKVLQRMKELNYRPNLAARALVTGRSHAIGLVAPDLVHPFFGQVAKALAGVLRGKGYRLMVSSSDDDTGARAAGNRSAPGPPRGCAGRSVGAAGFSELPPHPGAEDSDHNDRP